MVVFILRLFRLVRTSCVPTLLGVVVLLSGAPVVATTTTSRMHHSVNPDAQNIQLIESERVEEYKNRNYSWPIREFRPHTPGWAKLFEERLAQVADIPDAGERYEGYMQTIASSFLVPNFTEHGFGLGRCPEELIQALRKGIRDGYPTARYEHSVEVINGARSLFVDRPDLTSRVLHELQGHIEAWAGVQVTPYRAYGFRLYQNNSQLTMHVDKSQTHILSFILHIDSSDDAEPWPIFIEDFHGRTHEVILTPGDMLFYESSKCWHGRPRRLVGSWYSSIFVHYYPKHGWYETNHQLEAHYAIPPHWNRPPVHGAPPRNPRLQMLGTSMSEPDCPDEWCRSQESVKWSGPGEDGVWITPTFERVPLHARPRSAHNHDEL